MNFKKIYESDNLPAVSKGGAVATTGNKGVATTNGNTNGKSNANGKQAQNQQGFTPEKFTEYLKTLYDGMAKLEESLFILTFIKAHYLNKAAGASNIQVATQNMANVATGNQDTTQQDLQTVETTFTKYEQIAQQFAQQLTELGRVMQNASANEQDESLKNFLTTNSNGIMMWQNYIGLISQRFHSLQSYKGQLQGLQTQQPVQQ